jgi:hypothetical protein
MVSKLGRSIQGCESLLQKLLYGEIFARIAANQGAQWKIFEEILSMCMARWPVSIKIALSIKNG